MTDEQSEQIRKLLTEYRRSSNARTRLRLSSQVLDLVEKGTQSSVEGSSSKDAPKEKS